MSRKLSVVIPSYKDPYLKKTIESILENATGEVEVIAVLDGYWPDPSSIVSDPRVRYLHVGKNSGMRESINAGVRVATGDYLMRTDEHCMFAPGFDEVILRDIQDNWIVTPRRYFLDVEKWEIMGDLAPVDYMDLKVTHAGDSLKFSGVQKPGDDSQPIQESMAMQGSCWFMPHSLWDSVIGELDTERYGPLYQDSHEMVFKLWKAGGRLMVNKNTWHAHKHRKFPRTHNNGTKETPSDNAFTFKSMLDDWGDYFESEIKPKWGK